jgi:hypothetical protein
VREARELAQSKGSSACFAAGSFLPSGLGTIGQGPSEYLPLGIPLHNFDVIFAHP